MSGTEPAIDRLTLSSSPSPTPYPPETWQTAYGSALLVIMLLVLATGRVGADAAIVAVLAAMLVAPGILSISEAVAGFANPGLWTVMVLMVVAEAIHKTSALGWYMRRFLMSNLIARYKCCDARPRDAEAPTSTTTTAATASPSSTSLISAQLRIMLPVAATAAFWSRGDDAPLVVAMVPVVQQWAASAKINAQQLLIPLSWAALLGGTVTLMGSSANLIVAGALESLPSTAQPQENPVVVVIGLFEVAVYGIPNLLIGFAYVLLLSPLLLGRDRQQQAPGPSSAPLTNHVDDPILLGARLMPWSPAAGRSVERSGLRDTGGIYLVSAVRAQTGHVHRAVSRDFILNAGDVLYFTGLVESFPNFCTDHGLELLTNETEARNHDHDDEVGSSFSYDEEEKEEIHAEREDDTHERPTVEDVLWSTENDPVGVTKESLLRASRSDRLRSLAYMSDLIRGDQPPTAEELLPLTVNSVAVRWRDPRPQIVVAAEDGYNSNSLETPVCVGINCFDRPGLILDISQALQRLGLQFMNTEACVKDHRSVSVWRCRYVLSNQDLHNRDENLESEIWTSLNALLCPTTGLQTLKHRGLRVIRAQVTNNSRLIGKTLAQVDLRAWYGVAIVAVQSSTSRQGSPESHGSSDLASLRFREGDVLILQVDDNSPLLQAPPQGFDSQNDHVSSVASTSLPSSLVTSLFGGNISREQTVENYEAPAAPESIGEPDHGSIIIEAVHFDVETGNDSYEAPPPETIRDEVRAAWSDLKVLSHGATEGDDETDTFNARSAPEFLTAMRVSKGAGWLGKTARDVGLHNLPDLVLVTIERHSHTSPFERNAVESLPNEPTVLETLHHDVPLEEGDVLWFSGPASAIASLRRIPGIESYEQDEVKKMNENVHERRLVQAVVSRHSDLLGRTVREVQFRTRYGAAVIAVQREGKRVHELPGVIKLQAGDVLLLEAGPSFLSKVPQNDTSFSLLVEVKDSAPPRLRLLRRTLVIIVAAVVVYAAKVTTLLTSMLVASVILVLIRVLSVQEARKSLNWDLYVTVAGAFGIGTGLVNSGVAKGFANALVIIGTGIARGEAGVIAAVYFTNVVVSNVLTSAATVALLLPVALDAASQAGVSTTNMAFTLMLSASASFLYPYGNTANLLIYGPGKYKYSDFVRFGIPLQIILWISSTAVISAKSWHVPWTVSWSVFLAAVSVRVLQSFLISSCESNVQSR